MTGSVVVVVETHCAAKLAMYTQCMPKHALDRLIAIRVDERLYELIEADATANGRTMSQSVRFHVLRALVHQQGTGAA